MRPFLLSIASLLLATAARPEAKVLLIARGPCELLPAAEAFGLQTELRTDLPKEKELSSGRYSAVALCALDYPRPTLLSAEEVRALEGFVNAGGRAYVEFAAPVGGGKLFGVELSAQTRRALYQRLYLKRDLGAPSELRVADLLEEHNSACLVPGPLPREASEWLTYGLVIGTYRMVPRTSGFSVTVDLGAPRTIRAVSQRYGAGQSGYLPEGVQLWLGDDPEKMRRVAEQQAPQLGPVVRFELDDLRARYVRLTCGKHRRGPVTDFFFMGEIEVTDDRGANVALRRPYTLSPPPLSGLYGDSGGKLTDGVLDGPFTDGLSVGWLTEPPDRWEEWPGLVEVPLGKGTALLALSKLSDFRAREYRLSRRWEDLLRHVVLALVPPSEQASVARRYVPLRCRTDPPVWALPEAPVRLVVQTSPGARVHAAVDGGSTLVLSSGKPGAHEAALRLPAGEHEITVRAATAEGRSEQRVRLRVASREEAYRRALDRNMQWFRRSGVLPRPDGSAGVWSQRCLAWLDGGPDEFLASPFRVDCNAATAQALCAYGDLCGSEEWRRLGVNVARSMLPHQYADPARASFGAWPWLYEQCDAVYFWDDNTRAAVGLLWLYTRTRDEALLRAGLRTMELCREVAQEDGVIARHCIGAAELDRIGREAFRRLPPQGLAVDFDLLRWAWAYGVTGDPAYGELLRHVAEVWGGRAGVAGLPYALRFAEDLRLRERLASQWTGFRRDPDVVRLGAPRAGPGDYGAAFLGDCSITTTADDPLTDQLYTTPHLLLHALWGRPAGGGPQCREAFERLGDYLVRIQFESADPRLDGAWMRGFDFDNWEYYGAPYDPAYGPYSAYTGWMNAFASTAFAQYLQGADPLPPRAPADARAAQVLAAVRAERPVPPAPEDLARGASYELSVPPNAAYGDRGGELTDGVLDGGYEDGRSVGWNLREGEERRVEITLDLGRERRVAAVSQRYGAGQTSYCPDRTEVWAGSDREHLARVAAAARDGAGPGTRFLAFDAPVTTRYLRFVVTKRRVDAVTDFLFVGETEAFERP